MTIYVITHKNFKSPFDLSERKTILVGAADKSNINRKMYPYTDDQGDNISSKNRNYCELTGLYWVWRHSSDEYVGIEHYRRYFLHDFCGKHLLSDAEIKRILKKNDIILPFPKKLRTSIKEDYINNSGYKRDLDSLEAIIKSLYPNYYKVYANFMRSKSMYLWNMFITSRKIYDSYCTWLFSILFELEKYVDVTNYSDYQKRIYGFLGERLLNVWVTYYNLNVFQCGVINTEQKQNLMEKMLTSGKRSIYFRLENN